MTVFNSDLLDCLLPIMSVLSSSAKNTVISRNNTMMTKTENMVLRNVWIFNLSTMMPVTTPNSSICLHHTKFWFKKIPLLVSAALCKYFFMYSSILTSKFALEEMGEGEGMTISPLFYLSYILSLFFILCYQAILFLKSMYQNMYWLEISKNGASYVWDSHPPPSSSQMK